MGEAIFSETWLVEESMLRRNSAEVTRRTWCGKRVNGRLSGRLSAAPKHYNEGLRDFGIDALRAALQIQLAPQDVARFMTGAARVG